MRKVVFESGRWVKFCYDGTICIGKTYLDDAKDPDEPFHHLVTYITTGAEHGIISFYECQLLRYLRFGPIDGVLYEDKIKVAELTLESLVDLVVVPLITKEKTYSLARSLSNKIHQN